jgi:hypothetical protein
MPIRAFLDEKSFDPEAIEVMNAAFLAACADLGLTDKSDRACEIVAKRIIVLADGKRDAETLRTLVLASFRTKM